MKREWVILQDRREKKPLLFPDNLVCLDTSQPAHHQRSLTVRLVVQPTTLEYGDYMLACNGRGVIIERKWSLDEIATNCLSELRRRNFIRELERLRDHCSHPILLFESTLLEASRPTKQNPTPALALDALAALLLEYRVTPLFLPSSTPEHRRATGEFAARLLIRGATHALPDRPQ